MKSPKTKPAAERSPVYPSSGGSWIEDPLTGELTKVLAPEPPLETGVEDPVDPPR